MVASTACWPGAGARWPSTNKPLATCSTTPSVLSFPDRFTMAHAGTLTLQNVSKQYEVKGAALPVLQDISLSITPGEFVSIVGASGCGKSTLLRLIIGLEEGYQGQILLDGQRIKGTSLNRGIVFQEHRLFPWLNVRDNIGLGLLNSDLTEGQKRMAVNEHIELVGLNGFETAYPHQLSGGMSQRVAIARALVNRPDILLLDEPLAPSTPSHGPTCSKNCTASGNRRASP